MPIRQVFIKDELHSSIEANQINLCRYILMEANKSVLFPLLEEALEKSYLTKRRNTIKAVTSRIIKEFYQIHKNVLTKTSIWLGIECACKTTKEEGYKDCLCFFQKPKIIVVERHHSHFEDTSVEKVFAGFSIRIIDFMESNATEASIVANKILKILKLN
ncbi:unnamed protein product [Mytilus edulis]|uniref:Uncharacterized protein n=1 Tax=Mytilus edulis TaxID=6550 RepID=A0A8S3RN75_MYTED|nr:unnamed protein product [Mytilus edulis]